MSAVDSTVRTVLSAGGQILRAVTGLIAARPAAKPLHPRGSVVGGTLHRFGAAERTGVDWLDEVGDDPALVRQSRALGLRPPLPDIFGLAMRVPITGGRHGDLLFASTGLGRFTRCMLTPARSPSGRPLTTLLPYRAPAGPLLLSAVFQDERTVSLAWAVGAGAWHQFAELRLDDETFQQADAPLSFDPVGNTLPGLVNYDWVRRLRAPSYGTARRSRQGPGAIVTGSADPR